MPKGNGIQPRDLTMIKKAYAFFNEKGKTNICFSKMEIVQATGYKKSVVPKYVNREWRWCLVEEQKDSYRYTKLGCSEEEFIARHRGRWEQPPPPHVEPEVVYISKKPKVNNLHIWLLFFTVVVEWFVISNNWDLLRNGIGKQFSSKK